MRILATCDLHYGAHGAGDAQTRALARTARESGGDALIIAGDVAGRDKDRYSECLDLFADFPGRRLVVPGNHDLWSDTESARALHEVELPRRAADAGFDYLDAGPVLFGGVAFVGSIGWYDYAFRNPALDVPPGAYESKHWEGVARWNDGIHVRWDESDADVAARLSRRLADQIASVRDDAGAVVATVHHLPFAELVEHSGDARRDFATAFLGSPLFGEVLLAEPRVRLCVTGHTHREADVRIGKGRPGRAVRVVNPGSNYERKELVQMQLDMESAA